MVEGNLNTTNLLLGIMAAVSVLEALVIIGLGVMGYLAYSKTMRVVTDIEQRHVAPLMARVNSLMTTVDGVVADVRGITAKVGAQTERVDSAIRSTIDRVDETADRVKHSVAARVQRIAGLARGVRVAVDTLLHRNGHNGRYGTGPQSPYKGTQETTHG